MPTLWTIHLLGGLTAHRAGHEMIRFRVRKTSSVFAYLAFHINEDISRELLIESLWPNSDLVSGRHSLSESLSILRRQLEPPDVEPRLVLQADHSCVRIDGMAAATDLSRLKLTIEQCSETGDADEQLGLLRRAVSLYSGELLPGFFDDWILEKRDHLTASYLQLFHRLIMTLRDIGQSEEALEYALRATAISPDCEELHEEALTLMIDLGRKGDAIRHFDAYRRRLMRSDGQLPAPEICRIMQQFESRLNSIKPGRRKPGVRSGSIVCHTAHDNAPGDPCEVSRLPTPLTRFFGREEELAHVSKILSLTAEDPVELMEQGPARLVTVTGLGGCGKTRFAIEAGRQIEKQGAFGNRIAFVPLSGISRADEIPQAIADVLQLATSGGSQSVASQVMSELGRKRWLLILDNCEHLPEAHETVQKLIEYLPDLRILATSRMPLEVVGEHLFGLLPLAAPQNVTTPTALYEFPSVQMFVNRAQAVSHDFQITERNAETLGMIMQRLEGIPLAIELAAAHVMTLTPSQILTALADRFDLLTSRKAKGTRHIALKDTLDWSFELLSEEAQRFFVCLSVFRDGFTSESVKAVCCLSDTRGLLQDLAERSLIVPEPGLEVMRFSMLESLREYASERLDGADRARLAERHAAYYLQLARETAPAMRTSARRAAVGKLDEARGNLLAALEFVQGTPDELSLVAALWQYWEIRGYIEPGLRLLERAMRMDVKEHPDYAEALHGLGVFRDLFNDMTGAECAFRESLALSVDGSNHRPRVLISLAVLLDKRGDHKSASEFTNDALKLLRKTNDLWDVASCVNTLGRQYRFEGNLPAAEACFVEAQSHFETLEDWPSAAAMLHNIGCIASDLGKMSKARAAFERGLVMFRDLNRPGWIAYGLQCLGDTLGRQGDLRAAQAMLLECLDIRNQLHDHSGIATTVETLATLAYQMDDAPRAVRLAAGAAALRNELETPVARDETATLERDIESFRLSLSERDFEAAWDFGSALSLDRLVMYAREQRLISEDQNWETERSREREMVGGGRR